MDLYCPGRLGGEARRGEVPRNTKPISQLLCTRTTSGATGNFLMCAFSGKSHAVKVVARRDDPRTFYVPLLWWGKRSESDALNTVRRNEVPVIKEVNDSKWEINLTSNGTFPASVCARRMDRARPNVLRSQDEWTPPSLLQWTPYLLYQSEIWEEELFSGFNLWFN